MRQSPGRVVDRSRKVLSFPFWQLLLPVGIAAAFLASSPSCLFGAEILDKERSLAASRDFLDRVVSSGRQDLVDLQSIQNSVLDDSYLVHHPVTKIPVYSVVPVRSHHGSLLALVAVDAESGRWLWATFSPPSADFPGVTQSRARERALEKARALGAQSPRSDGLLIEGCDKHLYWSFESPDGSRWLIDADREEAPVLSSFDFSAERAVTPSDPEREGFVSDGRMAREKTPAEKPRLHKQAVLPQAYNIAGVPYHYQITDWFCGPAALQMIMDYWGEEIPQNPISDVANDVVNVGCYSSDMDRAAHFSGMSTAIQDPNLRGYPERLLGYACTDYSWGDDPGSYDDLKTLVSQNDPVFVCTWYSTAHTAGHFRVVKGYDDNLDVFIIHDPWYSGSVSGPNWLVDQSVFVEDLWRTWSWCWAMVAGPWTLRPSSPSVADEGDTLTVNLTVRYPGREPLDGMDLCTGCAATIRLPEGLVLASGTPTQSLPNLASGDSATVYWSVVAVSSGDHDIGFRARGVMTGSSYSYSTFTDSIGGRGHSVVSVGPVRLAGWENETRLTNNPASSGTCPPGGRAMAIDLEGTTHVVWADTRDGNSEIYYRSRQGLEWEEETRLTYDGAFSDAPAVAVDEDGRLHVAWVDTRDGNQEIYYKSMGPEGWSEDERVTNYYMDDCAPVIAAGGGEVYVAWERQAAGNTSFVVYFSFLDDTGWSSPTAPDNSALKESYRPSLAWGTDGLLHLVYERESASLETERIRYRSWNGISWSSAVVLSSDVSFSRNPVVAAGPGGTVHVVWQDGENLGGDIFYARYDGSAWQAAEELITGLEEAASPSVAVSGSGVVCVAWEDYRYGEPEVYLVHSEDRGWSDPLRMSAAPGSSRLPTVAAGVADYVSVVWTDLRDSNSEIYYRAKGVSTSVATRPEIPTTGGSFFLSTPHPAPFVSETRFAVSIPWSTDLILEVFNLAGRRVRTLASGEYGPGIHEWSWDGRSSSGEKSAPGVYFVSCSTPVSRDVKRVLLVR